MNWKSFVLGFAVGVALFSGISHFRTGTQNVIRTWPKEHQKAMLTMIPWLAEAKVGRLGPFIVMAPKSFDGAPEAMIQPAKEKYPILILSGNSISINDSKKRAITVDCSPVGEFVSYTYIPSLSAGFRFTDRKLDGSLEKVELPIPKK